MNEKPRHVTSDFDGFCCLWRLIGAHKATYSDPSHYRKTAEFLASGGIHNPKNWGK